MTLIEGQELTLDDFHLPARLVERTIEGVVLWLTAALYVKPTSI
jgi:hypothetical protein